MKKLICVIIMSCGVTWLHADQTLRSLQQTLKQQGYYYGNVTGETSAETTAAIRRYQIRNGLNVTGALNDETTRSLNGSINSVAAVSQTTTTPRPLGAQIDSAHPAAGAAFDPKLPLASFRASDLELETYRSHAARFSKPTQVRVNRRSIAEAQYQLMSRGYYRGRVDGKYGRDTASAARAFQSSAGLRPTGHLDPETLQAIGSSDTDFAYLAPRSDAEEVWAPIKKFKNGKWKVKWKRYFGRKHADEDGQANREPSWNFYNED